MLKVVEKNATLIQSELWKVQQSTDKAHCLTADDVLKAVAFLNDTLGKVCKTVNHAEVVYSKHAHLYNDGRAAKYETIVLLCSDGKYWYIRDIYRDIIGRYKRHFCYFINKYQMRDVMIAMLDNWERMYLNEFGIKT